jgi:hypothetical protein
VLPSRLILFDLTFSLVPVIQSNRAGERNKRDKMGKEEIISFLVAEKMIKTPPELFQFASNKVARLQTHHTKSVAFLLTKTKLAEKELRK